MKLNGERFKVGSLDIKKMRIIEGDDNVSDMLIQGNAASEDSVWACGGNDGGASEAGLVKYDKNDLTDQIEGVYDISDSDHTDSNTRHQTVTYYDGTLYIFSRDPDLYEFDPETLEYTGTVHREIIPPEESEVDRDGNGGRYEGHCKYEGQAFDEPKWFFNDKADRDDDTWAVYRTDEDFNFEKKYLVYEEDEDTLLSDTQHGPGFDGIDVFDYKNHTFMIGSITQGRSLRPGADLFIYNEEEDEFRLIGSPGELSLSEESIENADGDYDEEDISDAALFDEGFQIRNLQEGWGANRYPVEEEEPDDVRESAVTMFALHNCVLFINGCKKTNDTGVQLSKDNGVVKANV